MTRTRQRIVLGRLSEDQIIELVCPMDKLLRDAHGESNFSSEDERERAWYEHRNEVILFHQKHRDEYDRYGGSLPWPTETYDD